MLLHVWLPIVAIIMKLQYYKETTQPIVVYIN